MKIDDLARRQSAWLQSEGKDSDVVISSRVRLARNLNGYSFVGRATDLDLENLMTAVCGTFAELFDASKVTFVDFSDPPDDDAQFLFERRLVNREFLDSKRPRGLLFDNQEQFSVMVNEEDHLRIQAITPGFELETAYERVNSLDDRLESKLDYSFDDQYGYLTASPSNLGTGLRASVALHLPALVETGEMPKAIRGLQKVNLAVSGLYGLDERAPGDMFLVSSQKSLGVSEEWIVDQLREIIPSVINYERQARETLISTNRRGLLDRCRRALGVLHAAQTTTLEEATMFLSDVRFGLSLELLDNSSIPSPDELLLFIQPASLSRLFGREFEDEEDENASRAEFLSSNIPAEG